ncbi:MAG: hypothetical protein KC589_10300 [Nanoarchaeota archaeon]|nr:hypothetical protein [Nanoarchaeota archaeon]
MENIKKSKKLLSTLLFLPFIAIFFLLIVDSFYEKYAYIINTLLIGIIGFISIILFGISLLAYLKTRKEKFFSIMIAFSFFLLNGIILVIGLVFNINSLKIEVISNLFFLGTLLWLFFPLMKTEK